MELDPLCLVHNAVLGFVLYQRRRFDDAIDQLHKTLEMDPNFGVTLLFLGLSYMVKEKWEEAIATSEEICQSMARAAHFQLGFSDLLMVCPGKEMKH